MFGSKFTLFILLLQWVPSLLIPLPQEDNSTLDDLAEYTTDKVHKNTQHDTIQVISIKEGSDLIKITIKEMTLDPNGDENHEDLSTNVKQSTVSLEDVTEPAIDIHDDLNTKAITEENVIKEENNTKSDQNKANGTAFNDSIHDIEQVWNDFNNYQSRNYGHYEKKNNNVSFGDNPVKTPEAVVLIINSGIINDLLINSRDNNEIIKINDNRISSSNATEIKVTNIQSYNDTINDLVKSSIELVISNLLEDNSSNFNYKHVFLLLNSGNITNVRINTDTLNNSTTNINLKDTLEKHLNGIDIAEPIIVDNLKTNSE